MPAPDDVAEQPAVRTAAHVVDRVAAFPVDVEAGKAAERPGVRRGVDRRVEGATDVAAVGVAGGGADAAAGEVEDLLQRWGFWSVAAAGLTPIPYKVFTIGAGVVGIPRAQFVFASIVGRGLRFGVYGVLIFFWGERFAAFITDRFDLVASVFAAVAVVALLAWLGWRTLRARGAAA